jgi:hypothetical protein
MRQTDFLEPVPQDHELPADLRDAMHADLMAAISHDLEAAPRLRREAKARRHLTLVAAVLMTLFGVGAAWAVFRLPEQTTRILCPENLVIAAVSGDPIADCAAELREVGIVPPEMVAYSIEGGAVIVAEVDTEVPDDLQPLDNSFRQDTSIIELEAALNDVTTGLEADCFATDEAKPIVQGELDRLDFNWSIEVTEGADGESTCAFPYLQPETAAIGLGSIEAPLSSEGAQPWKPLGRRLNEALDTECLDLREAAAVVEDIAADLDMEEMLSLTETVDEQADCTRATVTVGGMVSVDLRGPAGE